MINDKLERCFKQVDKEYYQFNYPSTTDFILTCIDYFNLNLTDFTLESHYSGSMIYINSRIKSLRISFNQNSVKINEEEMKFIVLHELQHIMQYRKGDIARIGKKYFYKGKPVYEPAISSYYLNPIERDANEAVFNCPLFNKDLLRTSYSVKTIFEHYDFFRLEMI